LITLTNEAQVTTCIDLETGHLLQNFKLALIENLRAMLTPGG
jgi:hypothetical protein